MLAQQRTHDDGAQAQPARVAPAPVAGAHREVMRAPLASTPPAQRGDLLGTQLARAIQQRAATPVLQRAIIAIDGPSDTPDQQQSTVNCLANLRVLAKRGAAAGPAALGAIAPPSLADDETLYILAHGALPPGMADHAAVTVGDLTPEQMGAQILAWYGHQTYTGKIKLVACVSAGSAASVRGGLTYADALRSWFAANATAPFQPASIDGIIGVGWVDEQTGKQQSIDTMSVLIGDAGVFAELDPKAREAGIAKEYGPVGGPFRVTGKSDKGGGKVRYPIAYPAAAPMPAALAPAPAQPNRVFRFFRGAWNALMPCLP